MGSLPHSLTNSGLDILTSMMMESVSTPGSLTSEEILLGTAVVVGIATLCLLIAPRIRVPALLLLLPVGFVAGAFIPSEPLNEVVGDGFFSLVSISVGLILFHGGMELFASPIQGRDIRLIQRMVILGALLTWGAATIIIALLLEVDTSIAALLGAILIVSGPTVVGPLLAHIRPARRVRHILMWEGTLVDPLGALLAVFVFQFIQAVQQPDIASESPLNTFLQSLLTGTVAGLVGLALMWLALRLAGRDSRLGTIALLGSVVAAVSWSDSQVEDSGLLTAVIMGLLAPLMIRRMRKQNLSEILPFFDVVVSIGIGVLFVSISALVPPEAVLEILWPGLGVLFLLVVVVRPAIALLLTLGSTLNMRERIFIGSLAPRGIVAAATAAGFSAPLADTLVGSEILLPLTFLIIAGTVLIYSVGAGPMARLLKVRQVDDPEEDDPAEEIDGNIAIDLEYGREWHRPSKRSTDSDDN